MKAQDFENNNSRLTYTIEIDVYGDGVPEAWQAIDTDAGLFFDTIGEARAQLLIEQANTTGDDNCARWRIMERTEHPVMFSDCTGFPDAPLEDLRGMDEGNTILFCGGRCTRVDHPSLTCECAGCEGGCYCGHCVTPEAPEASAPEAAAPEAMKAAAAVECVNSTRVGKMWTASLTGTMAQHSAMGIKGAPLGRSTLSGADALRDLSDRILRESGIAVDVETAQAPEAPAPEAPDPVRQLLVTAGGAVYKCDQRGAPMSAVAQVVFKNDGRRVLSVGIGDHSFNTGINVAAIWHKPAELEAIILAAIAGRDIRNCTNCSGSGRSWYAGSPKGQACRTCAGAGLIVDTSAKLELLQGGDGVTA